ncbi:MAG: PAS domain-containing protein, partial [Bacteroidota bacterium]
MTKNDKINERLKKLEKENELLKRKLKDPTHSFFYNDILDTIDEGIILYEPKTGIIKYVNQVLTDLHGYSKNEILGLKITQLYDIKEGEVKTGIENELRKRGLTIITSEAFKKNEETFQVKKSRLAFLPVSK